MLIAIRQAIAKIARTDDLSLLRILGGYQIGRNRFTASDRELPPSSEPPEPPHDLQNILKYPDTSELFRDLLAGTFSVPVSRAYSRSCSSTRANGQRSGPRPIS